MKIFIAHSWSDVGINLQTKAVAKKLAETHKVVFFSQARIGSPELNINDSLRVIEWPNKRPNTIRDLLFICKIIRSEKPDIFIVHFGATNISMLAAWLLSVKYRICWLHTLTEQYFTELQNEVVAKRVINRRRRIYSLATNVVVLNEFCRKDAAEHYMIPQRKLVKIFNGINDFPGHSKTSACKYSIRFIGRLDYGKGVDILISAFSKIVELSPDITLDIAGKGSEEANLKFLIKKYALEEVIHLHGYFSNYRDATKFIADAYCLVVPSRMDNFPTVILEAFAAGVPVIASRAGGITEMIEDGKEGILVEPDDDISLANAIKRLAEDNDLRKRMSESARKSYEEKFSMSKHVEAVCDFINKLEQQVD